MKPLSHCLLRVETDRFGPFTFQAGVDLEDLVVPLQRVEDAHELFIKTPLNQVASQLEKEVVVSSVFGTNTIEGGTLSEAETARVLQLDPAEVKETEQRRAVNIKAAYDFAQRAAKTAGWRLDLDFIRTVHALITRDLPDPDMVPGEFRDNPKGKITTVGDEAHGGRTKPPQYGGDVKLLMGKLIEWHDCLVANEVPALIRAPLIHFYFETIHPFWDGNGRVGRVIEATLLQAAGYRYAPFAMARHYLDNIDEYFTLFNTCRKNAEKHGAAPNQPFVRFHLEGMRVVIHRLHERGNRIVGVLLYESQIRRALDRKEINARQYTILSQLLDKGPTDLEEMRHSPWYQSLYLKLNDKTRLRDMNALREMELLFLDEASRLWPGTMRAANIKPVGRKGS
ncbi:MAG: Fic family protein [Betaproteobacteria bacterium]|nr:Fic family protein [Betaproteobacteria bacterium]